MSDRSSTANIRSTRVDARSSARTPMALSTRIVTAALVSTLVLGVWCFVVAAIASSFHPGYGDWHTLELLMLGCSLTVASLAGVVVFGAVRMVSRASGHDPR
ncbi:hypothetical protein [Schumannella sp. 10F1B-5-1]|uniref:hypothetical protein n=1 Tax=Schumannella sp. 10F1B-5-1 TaxID=2590780 RepID=UPI00113090A2|nr:hypothetical protein [Schumannella sp. 10F1B-5-1]TPW76718.1 hypothetical protein FJ658_01890 [Schumannella sp. 10F1B-5-1]